MLGSCLSAVNSVNALPRRSPQHTGMICYSLIRHPWLRVSQSHFAGTCCPERNAKGMIRRSNRFRLRS
jgi:hypothetical protein